MFSFVNVFVKRTIRCFSLNEAGVSVYDCGCVKNNFYRTFALASASLSNSVRECVIYCSFVVAFKLEVFVFKLAYPMNRLPEADNDHKGSRSSDQRHTQPHVTLLA